MLNNFWKNIINRGVTPDLEFKIRNKVRIFNSSIFVIGALYLFYTVVGIFRGDYLAASLTFLSWVISAFCLYLMSQKKYELAYHITAILGIAFLFCFSALYGEETSTHTFFLFLPVAATVLFDNFKTCFYYFILTIIAIASAKLFFLYGKPYYPFNEANKYLGFLNTFMTATLIYLAVRMFKHENLNYSNEINEQRDIIKEKNKDIVSSIQYAQRIQNSLLPTEVYIDKTLKRLNKS